MNPGREMDVLVAEKPMGQKVKSAADLGGLYSAEGDFFVNPPDRSEPVYAHTLPLPHYSTDIAAAFEVLEKLGTEWAWTIQHGGGNRAEATFWMGDTFHEAEADTVPHAICLAALKAVQ